MTSSKQGIREMLKARLSRRRFLRDGTNAAMFAAIASQVALPTPARAGSEVNVLAWEGYDDPAIVKIAARIKSETNGPYHFAKSAYDFTIDHITYPTPSPAWGSCTVLKQGNGDCGRYAAVVVAICRAGRLPARPRRGTWSAGGRSRQL